jgi:transcriptional regulator with XRE-family HTH domain
MSRVAGRPLEIVEIDGEAVRQFRTALAARVSQEALARRAGVSGALIGHIETGYTRRVSRRIADAIAAELGVTPETLIRPRSDVSVESSLQKISSMLERLVGRPAGGLAENGAASDLDIAQWATDFMRENSRRSPSDRPVPPAEEVARLATHRKVSVGFDVAAMPEQQCVTTQAELFNGWSAVAQAIVEALREGTASPPSGPNRTILFTYQGHDLFAVVGPDVRAQLLDTLRRALDKGWNVLHLVRYSLLERRYLDITSQAVELAGRPGRYVAKYVADDPDSSTEFDLLIIPGYCTMQLWGTEAANPPDAALKLSDPSIQRQMAAVFQKNEAVASQLIDTYPQYTALLRVLQYPGHVDADRYEIKPGPALATVPKDLWRWAARQVRQPLEDGPGQQDALDLIDQYERAMIKRSRLLDSSLSSYSTRGLMTIEALDDLVGGRYDHNDWLIVRAQQMQPDASIPIRFRIQHLERLIELLDRYHLFQLGIADGSRMDGTFPQNLLTVRVAAAPHRSAAFVQVWPENRESSREEGFFAVFREPRIVGAFHDYFQELWNGPGVTTERGDVREILRQRLSMLVESQEIGPVERRRPRRPR